MTTDRSENHQAGRGDKPATGFASETTPEGEQTLVPGVAPITMRDRLALRASAPMTATKQQQPCDVGLFDAAARNQLDLLDLIAAAGRGK